MTSAQVSPEASDGVLKMMESEAQVFLGVFSPHTSGTQVISLHKHGRVLFFPKAKNNAICVYVVAFI